MYIKYYKSFLEESKLSNIPIKNVETYINNMSMSINDKLFFLNENIKFDCIVDFGCANGLLLKEITKNSSKKGLIGYDIDKNMISMIEDKKNIKFYDNWDNVISEVKLFKAPLLNLSSVIHEVYSYEYPINIKKFWDKMVFNGDFKYISIRDMIPSTNMEKTDINKFKNDVRKVKLLADKEQLNSFEKRWGTIDDNYKTLTHFLLKYRYTKNWEREVNENYLPISLETLKKKIPKNYTIKYEENFILPFIKNIVKKDFNIDLKHPTHCKMIIERNY